MARKRWGKWTRIWILSRGCAKCGRTATEIDHIVPLSEGGLDEVSNLQALCSGHHRNKTVREMERRLRGYPALVREAAMVRDARSTPEAIGNYYGCPSGLIRYIKHGRPANLFQQRFMQTAV